MIDIENEVFTLISKRLREEYDEIFITGERINSTTIFPTVSIIEISNIPYTRTSTNEIENHSKVTYEVQVYSNKQTGKKSECKKIISIVDDLFKQKGFVRVMLQPVDNSANASIYRMIGRFTGVVSKDKIIYRS